MVSTTPRDCNITPFAEYLEETIEANGLTRWSGVGGGGGGALSSLLRRTLPLLIAHAPAAACVHILCGGGEGALAELEWHLLRGWPAVVVANSGPAADCLPRLLPEGKASSAQAGAAAAAAAAAAVEAVEQGGTEQPRERPLMRAATACALHSHLIVPMSSYAEGDLDRAIRQAQVLM